MRHYKDKTPQDKLTYFAFIDNTEYNVMIIICHKNDEKQMDRSQPQSLKHQIQVVTRSDNLSFVISIVNCNSPTYILFLNSFQVITLYA